MCVIFKHSHTDIHKDISFPVISLSAPKIKKFRGNVKEKLGNSKHHHLQEINQCIKMKNRIR